MRAMLAAVQDFPLLRQYRELMTLYTDVRSLAWQLENFTVAPPDMSDIEAIAAGRRSSLERTLQRLARIGQAAERIGERARDIGAATTEVNLLGQGVKGQTAALQTMVQQAALQTAAVQNETNTLLAILQLQLAAEGREAESEMRRVEKNRVFYQGVPGWED